ncbi:MULTISPECIES: tRNA (adenosine(37)-N6)-threonylcarbamoyltransferase complex transferase subunit TsaD [unclassified Flavobacterium]|jgi:N6-L-threonylcarbamoyladenine synthase|uniref:tRNA (adenosine(37)-N6)-threonylcarbamoyltransferase complex transferase subunit TsaD n=1 Tax=unclassified Flavobacterium TaxID=196869 RepID=UPI00070E48A7|nr:MULTISPECIES: tRNA (adenosine(37)-N6)-threonylcarbamoyltransferase complex transferase subunit TsaD [unclassified Flavobacterium]KRD61490.1 tRNA threonylcarbamoyl adenosine modification protein TsaD [Flavobacterium sp. Root935]MDQ1166703.1 N6-L-threonylcarbamoyladenine synthase [Flavobacterium sp. SORGH_AS_0622]TDX12639.1 O-sialoglycoprotein endopeptidase [Flavobacterium sp. S87F.05.LMB.W.Kidney.N]BDU27175.1 tRNA N6-adenosine threonylcarbamoyltransferase [Flavobacterium sp. GSB-24]
MQNPEVFILAIESSCDDTAAAVLHNDKVLSNVVANQLIHNQYGGVVPELASRAHQQNIVPVIDAALRKANVQKEQLSAIAFTQGPGLMGSLLVGTSFSKSLSLALDIPLIAVNHMHAHILAHFIDEEGYDKPEFPFLALTISGGHTQIVKVNSFFDMEIIGETTDDAVGEAFDKSAKILGLPYPGGPLIDKYAKEGNPKAFTFTKPKVPGLDFSFSGLKTAILYFIQKNKQANPNFIEENLNDICASIQHTIIEILMDKIKMAVKETGITQIAIGGGVSANSGIRTTLKETESKYGWKTFIPKFEYTTDNAAMIGIVGYQKYLSNRFETSSVVSKARIQF